MATYDCHVLIMVECDNNGQIIERNEAKGHYMIQIDHNSFSFDGRTYTDPVISYHGGENSQGYVALLEAEDLGRTLSGGDGVRKLYRFSFRTNGENVTELKNMLLSFLDMSSETSMGDMLGYKVKTGPFQTYNVETSNCFSAAAVFCSMLGYNGLVDIYENASEHTDYLAWKMYKQHGNAWTHVGTFD